MSQIVIGLIVLITALVCWALAELRFAGWHRRKRRITLLLVLAIAMQLAAWRIMRGS